MNKEEKEFAKKILASFSSEPKKYPDFTREENIILERWRVHRIINEDAFLVRTSKGSTYKQYAQKNDYPFTSFGDEEINKDWYLKFRNSRDIIIIRDILTVVAFLISLYLAISKIFQN